MSPNFDAKLLKCYHFIAKFIYLWSALLDLYNIWAIFLYVVYVFEFFLWKFMCWHNESHSTHGPLWNTVDIHILVIPKRFFNMLHNTSTFLWLRSWHVKVHGDLGATNLSYFFENKRI